MQEWIVSVWCQCVPILSVLANWRNEWQARKRVSSCLVSILAGWSYKFPHLKLSGLIIIDISNYHIFKWLDNISSLQMSLICTPWMNNRATQAVRIPLSLLFLYLIASLKISTLSLKHWLLFASDILRLAVRQSGDHLYPSKINIDCHIS